MRQAYDYWQDQPGSRPGRAPGLRLRPITLCGRRSAPAFSDVCEWCYWRGGMSLRPRHPSFSSRPAPLPDVMADSSASTEDRGRPLRPSRQRQPSRSSPEATRTAAQAVFSARGLRTAKAAQASSLSGAPLHTGRGPYAVDLLLGCGAFGRPHSSCLMIHIICRSSQPARLDRCSGRTRTHMEPPGLARPR